MKLPFSRDHSFLTGVPQGYSRLLDAWGVREFSGKPVLK
jgi:hypothetical protein